MVVESLITPEKAEKKPVSMLYAGFFYSTLGLFFSALVFEKYASFAAIFLTTMPLIVLMYKSLQREEEKDMQIKQEKILVKEHSRVLSFFMALFLGIVLSYTLWFTVLPHDIGANLFEYQINSLEISTSNLEGQLTAQEENMITIFLNNASVWLLCLVFSFTYGAGAVFILTLNASILGAAIGDIIRKYLSQMHLAQGTGFLETYANSMCYLIHGIPEISAYFLAALGGGIISVAVANHHYRSKKFVRILVDSSDLVIISIIVLTIAAVIEAYLTPGICAFSV